MSAVLLVLLLVPAVLVSVTAIGSRRIGRALRSVGTMLRVDGVDLHILDETPPGPTDGLPPAVFLHGASGNLNEPRTAMAGRLPGRRCLYLDRPGHGHSSRPGRRYASPAAQADLVDGLLGRLGIERAVVVGHSWGGAVAAALAVSHPDRVAGLVFVAPATHPWPGGVSWTYRIAARPIIGRLFAWTLVYPIGIVTLEKAMAGVFHPEPVPERYRTSAHIELVLRPSAFIANAEDVADLKANVTALAPRYPEITAPTVIVTGDRDAVVWPSIHSEGLKRDIAGAELVLLPGAGHMPHHTHPDAVVAAIARVTERHLAGETVGG